MTSSCQQCLAFRDDVLGIYRLVVKNENFRGPWHIADAPGIPPPWLQLVKIDSKGVLYFKEDVPRSILVAPMGAVEQHIPADHIEQLPFWKAEFDQASAVQRNTAACAAINALTNGARNIRALCTDPTPIRTSSDVYCLHNLLAKRLVVKRMTPNQGREYFQCPVADRNEQCSLFVWGDDERYEKSDMVADTTKRVLTAPRDIEDAETVTNDDMYTAMERVGLARTAGLPATLLQSSSERKTFVLVMRTVYDSARVDTWNAEQGTPEWHRGRYGRITASVAAAAQGDSQYATPAQRCRESVWAPTQDSLPMRWGRVHEDDALEIYKAFLAEERPTAVVTCHGLWVNPAFAHLGASPDAIVHDGGERWCVEIKCPRKLVERKKGDPFFPLETMPDGRRAHCTAEYYVQTQMQMLLLGGIPWCDFVACAPTGMQVTRIPLNPQFAYASMLPALQRCAVQMLYPAFVWKELDMIRPGFMVPNTHNLEHVIREIMHTSAYTVPFGTDEDNPVRCERHHRSHSLGIVSIFRPTETVRIVECYVRPAFWTTCDETVVDFPLMAVFHRSANAADASTTNIALCIGDTDIGTVVQEPVWMEELLLPGNDGTPVKIHDWIRVPHKQFAVYVHISMFVHDT